MKKAGIAILGFGVVGSGAYRLLTEHKEFYKKTQNVELTVESVLTLNKQAAIEQGVPEEILAGSIAEVIANPNVDIVIECIGGVGAAREYVRAALYEGKSVVTSNKELICKYSHELERTAKSNQCGLYFEASCVGGVPIIRTLLDGVQSNCIKEMMGIINGTTNYILTKMETENASYEAALKKAQQLGFAEADPTNDVEGIDATYKLSILSSLAFHTKVPFAKIYREGISKIEKADIAYGREFGYALKLLAIGKQTEKGIEVRVHPTFIPENHPLATVSDNYNAVYLRGDSVDDIMLYGKGAGSLPTASAVVSDVIYAATHAEVKYSTFKNTANAEKDVKFVSDFESAYYIRLSAEDRAGVLAKISGLLAKYDISVVELNQKGMAGTDATRVPLLVVTHRTTENAIKNATKKINETGLATVEAVIRVEN